MPKYVDSDCISIIAARRTADPELAAFFQQLSERAEKYANMDQIHFEAVRENRARREGKEQGMTPKEKRLKKRIDDECSQTFRDFEKIALNMDNASLLGFTLYLERGMVETWEQIALKAHNDDKMSAESLVGFRKETVSIIEQFVEASPLRERVFTYIKGVEKWA